MASTDTPPISFTEDGLDEIERWLRWEYFSVSIPHKAADAIAYLRLQNAARGSALSILEREKAELQRALEGLLGLIELVSTRNDLPVGLDDLMRLNHRTVAARAALATAQPSEG